MIVLKAENITKTYQVGARSISVLHDVSLEVESGEFLAITGKSGSGKSTFMNILGCLDTATSGIYKIEGEDVSKMSVDELAKIRNKDIGFVFQRFHLLADMTAIENIVLPQLYANVPENDAKKRALELLETVELAHRGNHYPAELSGGEQQRVAVARALANKPAIILADEPTGNLDSATGRKIMDLFRKLNKEQGVTIIIITHDPQLAQEADRVVHLHDGNIVST